jgi:translation initiation factor 1
MTDKNSRDRVVYSTHRPQPPTPRDTPQAPSALPAGLQARVQREKAHRAGRWVTVVYDLDLPEAQLSRLCAQIKKACATGGTVKDGRLEIQGDHAQKIMAELAALGIRARRSGA